MYIHIFVILLSTLAKSALNAGSCANFSCSCWQTIYMEFRFGFHFNNIYLIILFVIYKLIRTLRQTENQTKISKIFAQHVKNVLRLHRYNTQKKIRKNEDEYKKTKKKKKRCRCSNNKNAYNRWSRRTGRLPLHGAHWIEIEALQAAGWHFCMWCLSVCVCGPRVCVCVCVDVDLNRNAWKLTSLPQPLLAAAAQPALTNRN